MIVTPVTVAYSVGVVVVPSPSPVVEDWQNSYIDSFQLIYEYVIEDGIIRGKIPAVPD